MTLKVGLVPMETTIFIYYVYASVSVLCVCLSYTRECKIETWELFTKWIKGKKGLNANKNPLAKSENKSQTPTLSVTLMSGYFKLRCVT